MHADVIIQKPRTAKMSVKQPTANDNTSVILVINIATEDSDNAATIRAFRASFVLPKLEGNANL
jgi:hypothetical protein